MLLKVQRAQPLWDGVGGSEVQRGGDTCTRTAETNTTPRSNYIPVKRGGLQKLSVMKTKIERVPVSIPHY